MPDNVFKDTLYMYSVEGQGRKQAKQQEADDDKRQKRRQAKRQKKKVKRKLFLHTNSILGRAVEGARLKIVWIKSAQVRTLQYAPKVL